VVVASRGRAGNEHHGRSTHRPWRIEGSRSPQQAGNREQGGGSGGPGTPQRRFGWLWLIVILVLALNYGLGSLVFKPSGPQRVNVPYSYFRAEVEKHNIQSITATGETIEGRFRHAVRYPPGGTGKGSEGGSESAETALFKTERPAFASENVVGELIAQGAKVEAKPATSGTPVWELILVYFGPAVLFIGFFVLLMRRAAAGGGIGGGLTGIGRSRARRYQGSEGRTTFQDVAGIDEAKEELHEVVDFLKHPERYRRLGGVVPKGVLLSGDPGTGKTLLARAVAGEADVPFFSVSAAEFIEMIVGVGASRVRDLFEQAKREAPAIIFIDELDAIGRTRGSATMPGGGHDEREQTLNQILTEMDGFTGNEGVIVLAATNRPEVLDAALLRPGRFDRRVTVSPPDQRGRRQILQVHTRSVPLGEDVDLEQLASSTPGMVGADLRNLVNEAALLAARRGHDRVARADFGDALEKLMLGAERRILLSPEERERTAFHESGHALLGMLEPGADPVRKISIIPRGRALGVTFQSPERDRYGYSESYLRGRLTGMLGGRAAEQLILGETTTGAESDLEQATRLAREMVGRWGFSKKVGMVSVLPHPSEQGAFFPGAGPASERTKELVDEEVRAIVDECYERALEMLRTHRGQLEALAQALLERETLDEVDAYAVAGIPRRSTPQDEDAEGAAAAAAAPGHAEVPLAGEDGAAAGANRAQGSALGAQAVPLPPEEA
jgi:cell division protease FtsH